MTTEPGFAPSAQRPAGLVEQDLLDSVHSRDHHECNFRPFAHRAGGFDQSDPVRRLDQRSVPGQNPVSRGGEVACHRPSHGTEADKTNVHFESPSLSAAPLRGSTARINHPISQLS